MQPHDVPPQVLKPEPVPAPRRRALSSEKFWALMDRWNVPTPRALSLIGYDGAPNPSDGSAKPQFQLSDEQAKTLSCLLEIELTLTVAGVRERGPRKPHGLPVDAMGRCDASQAAMVLWSLNRASGLAC